MEKDWLQFHHEMIEACDRAFGGFTGKYEDRAVW
jgi:hypothetical protein